MKLIGNSIFLLSVLTYILVGTVPVWKCFKENTLHINSECYSTDKNADTCCSKKSIAKQNFDSKCCEQVENDSAPVYNNLFPQTTEIEQEKNLAFHIFNDAVDNHNSIDLVHFSNAPPQYITNTPIYKLNNTYLC